MFVRIADHNADARDRCDFFWSSLCVAAGHEDFGFRIPTMNAADRRPHVLVGRCGDCTRIEDDDFSLDGRACARQPAIKQLSFNGRTVSLCRAAAEIFDKICPHSFNFIGTNVFRSSLPRCSQYVPENCS